MVLADDSYTMKNTVSSYDDFNFLRNIYIRVIFENRLVF